MIDHVLNWLKANNKAPTIGAYCELNYLMSWADLQRGEFPEWVAEVLDLAESGDLRVLTPETGRKQ